MRNVLVIDAPGLRAAEIPALPALRALAAQGAARLVPIACGSAAARRASLATGLLPMHHGVIRDGTPRVPTVWQRVPGLRAAFPDSAAGIVAAMPSAALVWATLALAPPELDAALAEVLPHAGQRVIVVAASTVEVPATPAALPKGAWHDGRVAHADNLRGGPAFRRVLTGPARGELGLDCPEAGTMIAELKPGLGFGTRAPVGPDAPEDQLPALVWRGLPIAKTSVGLCEIAWHVQHALTGTEYRDEV